MSYSDNNLVYSTSGGRICPDCKKSIDQCVCVKKNSASFQGKRIRVRRDKKGRRGKTVTIISGIPLNENGLLELASELKRKCGTGGSVKNDEILIQGDRIEIAIKFLEKKGYSAKRAGG